MIRSLSSLDNFHECSDIVQKALLRLEKESKKRNYFTDSFVDIILVLGEIEPNYLSKFVQRSKNKKFYTLSNDTEQHDIFPLLCETDIDITPVYQAIKDDVLENGGLTYNIEEHTGLLLFYVRAFPNSEITKKGINFWLKNWKSQDYSRYKELTTLSLGLRSLAEFDPIKFKKELEEHTNFILGCQKPDGSFYKKKRSMITENTAHCVIALSEIIDPNDKTLQKSLKFLQKELEKELNSEYIMIEHIALILLALFILGDGPKISRSQCRLQKKKLVNQIQNLKSQNNFQTNIMSKNWGQAVYHVSLLEAFLKKWLVKNNHKKMEDSVKHRIDFAKLVNEVKRELKNQNISFELQYFSNLMGQRDFRNHIIHELYEPSDNELKNIIKTNLEFMEYLNQITKGHN